MENRLILSDECVIAKVSYSIVEARAAISDLEVGYHHALSTDIRVCL